MNEHVSQDNPYAAPVARVADVDIGEQVLAERLTRLGAIIIDGVLFMIAYVPAIIAYMGTINGEPVSVPMMATGGVLVVALLIYNLVQLHRTGQTIGKKLLNIRIVRADGSRAGLARIFFARMLPTGLLGAIPFLGLVISLVDALLIFRDSRRCLHDQIADTIVVKL